MARTHTHTFTNEHVCYTEDRACNTLINKNNNGPQWSQWTRKTKLKIQGSVLQGQTLFFQSLDKVATITLTLSQITTRISQNTDNPARWHHVLPVVGMQTRRVYINKGENGFDCLKRKQLVPSIINCSQCTVPLDKTISPRMLSHSYHVSNNWLMAVLEDRRIWSNWQTPCCHHM